MKTVLTGLMSLVLLFGSYGCASRIDSGTPADTPRVTAAGATEVPIAGDIGNEAALAIALGNAGLQESQITLHKNMLGFSDGHAVFDIVFYYGNTTYEYLIEASSGEVLSAEQS